MAIILKYLGIRVYMNKLDHILNKASYLISILSIITTITIYYLMILRLMNIFIITNINSI